MHHETVGVGDVEEVDSFILTGAHAVVIDLAVVHSYIPAAVEIDSAVAAFIKMGPGDGHITAVHGLDTDGAATVETAGIHGDIAAAVKHKDAARTEAGDLGMSGREMFDSYIFTGGEFEDVGVAGNGSDGCLFLPGAADREVVDTNQRQLGAQLVILHEDFAPGIIGILG